MRQTSTGPITGCDSAFAAGLGYTRKSANCTERNLALTSSPISLAALSIGSMLVVAGSAAADNSAPIPALSGQWGHSNLNLEQPATGPKIMTNTLFRRDGTIDDDAGRLADYKSSLLTPRASGILKARGEYSMTGMSIPDPHNQCWPEPPPFTMSIQIELLVV